MLLSTVVGTALTGCHFGLAMLVFNNSKPPYRAEEIATELGPAAVRTMGCLDVGLEVFEGGQAESTVGTMVDVHLGNRCGYPEELDLRRIEILATTSQNKVGRARLDDPRAEVTSLHVGGSERGRERFRLVLSLADAERLCFDVEKIAPEAPEARPRPICFLRRENIWGPT